MNSNPIRRLYPIAVAHLTIELCSSYLPVIYPIRITTRGLRYAQVGLVTLVGVGGATLAQPIFGYLSDRWESRHIIPISVIWVGLLMGLVGVAPSYWLLILLVGLAGLGSAAFHPAGASAAGSITAARRGAALSVFSVSGSLGAGLSPLLMIYCISRWELPGTMVLIPVTLLIGLLLYHQSGREGDAKTGSAPTTAEGHARARSGSLTGLVLVVLAAMCRSWFQVGLITYLPEWVQGQGGSLVRGGQVLTALLISVSIGALIGGPLSDRVGRWQVLALSLGLLGPAQWFFMTADSPAPVGWAILIGILIGASFPVTVAMAQEAWPRRVGLASALAMGLGWLPGGLGASVTGLVADQTSLTAALGWLVIAPALGLACALIYGLVWTRHGRDE
ncbi:MAG: MFS transporter [Ardenticatenia bacterium]|nr:MFS transporter [Ardenticatenia bacterium]